jgi:hypothetical protein
LSLIALHSIKLQAQKINDEVISVLKTIEYNYFLEHLKYLASDELKGRGIGSIGFDKAANYVTDEFKKNGLLPYGDSDTYFQEVILSKSSIKKGSFELQIEKNLKTITANYGSNISVVLSPKYENINEKQNMVFVGYGNIIPDENINDYNGVNVKGKTVIVALGGPKGIENSAFNNRQAKFDNAMAQGANGIILFYPKAGLFQNLIFKKVHGFLSKHMLSLADTSIQASIVDIDLKLAIFAKKEFIKEIFALNGLSLKKELRNIAKGNSSSQEFASELNCSYKVEKYSIISKNVVALLPGSDTNLKNEYVVLGSHLDGLGIGKTKKGDSIYNGMLDNASGVSALLSIAKTFNSLSEKPKRSIIFICYTSEENGLLGSNYFANRNNIVNGNIVANINVDMLSQTFETLNVAPLGYSHSNLSKGVDYAANLLKLKIDDNKQAEIDYIERSDQISFIKKGIPALFIAGGYTAVNHKKNGKKSFDKWMKKKYHSPFDDLNQKYSDKAFLTAIKFNFLTTYYISNYLEQIKWNKSGWLYKKYVLKTQ